MRNIRRDDSLSFDFTLFPGEFNSSPSMTVPDQTLSMRQILDRYTRGLPIDASVRIPEADDAEDEFYPDIAYMDLADVQRLRDDAAERVRELKAKAKSEADAAKAARLVKTAAAKRHEAQSGEAGATLKMPNPAEPIRSPKIPGRGIIEDEQLELFD